MTGSLYIKLVKLLVLKQKDLNHFMTHSEYKEFTNRFFRIDKATAREVLRELKAEGLIEYDNDKIKIKEAALHGEASKTRHMAQSE
jgi:predicted transcriptional regulator